MAQVGFHTDFFSWPPSIWHTVFQAARPVQVKPEIPLFDYHHFVDQKESHQSGQPHGIAAYRWYLQLKSVCKTFRMLFHTHPDLVTDLILCPALNAWISRFQQVPQWLAAKRQITFLSVYFPDLWFRPETGPQRYGVQSLFDTLEDCSIHLKEISLTRLTGAFQHLRVHPACAMASVTTCHISSPVIAEQDTLTLEPLKAMYHLKSLTLQHGRYSGLTVPSSLMTLRMYCASLQPPFEGPLCDWSEVGNLQRLVLQRATLGDMPAKGLSACTGLVKLDLLESRFKLAYRDYKKGFLDGTSALCLLTTLCIMLTRRRGGDAFCRELQYMTSLRKLDLLCREVRLPVSLGLLIHLTELTIKTLDPYGEPSSVVTPVVIEFDWGCLHALQSITMVGTAVLGRSIACVYLLPHIKRFSLQPFWPGDLRTLHAITELQRMFSQSAPHVFLDIDCRGFPPHAKPVVVCQLPGSDL